MRKKSLFNVIITIFVFAVLLVFTFFSRSDKHIDFSSGFNLFFLLLMFVISLGYVLFNVRRAISIRSDLEAAADSLKNGKNWREISFSNTALQNAFTQYIDEMDRLSGISTENDNNQPVSCDIEDYINVALLNGVIKKSLCESVSGSMTGLGLLGTFLGLIIGLKDFSTDYDEIQDSILMLLNGIKTSFLTSIYGVVFSIVFNWIYRSDYTSMLDSLNDFYSVFHNKAVSDSQNDINSRLVSAQENMTDSVEKLILVVSEGITQQFRTSMDKMTDTVSSYLNAAVADQQEKLSLMVKQYLDTMNNDVLGGHFEKLRDSLKSINNTNENYHIKMNEMLGLFNENTQTSLAVSREYSKTVDSFSTYIASIEEHQKMLNEASSELSANMAAMTVRYDAQNESMKNIIEQINSLNGTVASLTAFCSQLETAVQASDESRKQLSEEAGELIRQVSSSNDNINKNTMLILEKSENTASMLQNYAENRFEISVNALSALSEEFRAVSENIGKAYSELTDKLHIGLSESFAVIDSDTSEIVKKFSSTLEEMKETAADIPETLRSSVENEYARKMKQAELLNSILNGRDDVNEAAAPIEDTEPSEQQLISETSSENTDYEIIDDIAENAVSDIFDTESANDV